MLRSLSSRLKFSIAVWIAVSVGSIFLTLLFSWKLEGGAAAINAAGSLRMQVYRIVNLIENNQPDELIQTAIKGYELTLKTLEEGDPKRPLFLPDVPEITLNMTKIHAQWDKNIRPLLVSHVGIQDTRIPSEIIDNFVNQIHQLVYDIEVVDDRYTAWLRIFQTALMVMVLMGACITIALLYLWIIRPLEHLQNGVKEILKGNFGATVQIASTSEFAQVDEGFNRMSAHLKQLYTNLEQEVQEKTQDLERKNQFLLTLYQFSTFLNSNLQLNQTCEGFLQKLQEMFSQIDALSIRIIDTKTQRTNLVAQINLPSAVLECGNENCYCGPKYNHVEKNFIHEDRHWTPIEIRREPGNPDGLLCLEAEYTNINSFPIQLKDTEVGYLTLFFKDHQHLQPQDNELIYVLGNQLAVVISNNQLIEESRQLAVLQERNLIAQGLHDSIAQTLNFLNLQTQMLDSAMKNDDTDLAQENLAFIQTGIKECYEDVRELLLNFRTKITNQEFTEAVDSLIQRFEKQTTIATTIDWIGQGPSLTPDQQLQFIFILQESLSNVRKHSNASNVSISFRNEGDYQMVIRDNGDGFDVDNMHQMSAEHVGLRIMQERAKRIHANLEIHSILHDHTEIILTLPQKERIYS